MYFLCVCEDLMCFWIFSVFKKGAQKMVQILCKNIFLCQKRCTKNGSKNIITYYGFPIKIFIFCKNMRIFYVFAKILMCFWIFSVLKKGAQKMIQTYFYVPKKCAKNGTKNIITYYGFPIKIFIFCKNMCIFYAFVKIFMCFWIFYVFKKGEQKMVQIWRKKYFSVPKKVHEKWVKKYHNILWIPY